MGAGHSHGANASERRLRIALYLTGAFLLAEVVGGVLTKSLALISDAAHMFTDTAALAIALAAVRIGRRPADLRRTYGYYRFEILAAAFNALLLFAVAAYILYEAYQRLQHPPEVQSVGMLVIASLGLVVNFISMRLLSGGKDESLNVKGAYLEVWSDMLGSAGVIIGAIVILMTGWTWVDTAVAVLIALWVLPRTWVLLKETLNVLLEGVPSGMDLGSIRQSMLSVGGVSSIHDLHVWEISSGRPSLTAHVVCKDGTDFEFQIMPVLSEMLREKFDIEHTTFQGESRECQFASKLH